MSLPPKVVQKPVAVSGHVTGPAPPTQLRAALTSVSLPPGAQSAAPPSAVPPTQYPSLITKPLVSHSTDRWGNEWGFRFVITSPDLFRWLWWWIYWYEIAIVLINITTVTRVVRGVYRLTLHRRDLLLWCLLLFAGPLGTCFVRGTWQSQLCAQGSVAVSDHSQSMRVCYSYLLNFLGLWSKSFSKEGHIPKLQRYLNSICTVARVLFLVARAGIGSCFGVMNGYMLAWAK